MWTGVLQVFAIERDNPLLKGVLLKDYARPNLNKARLGQLIDLISSIGLGGAENRFKDIHPGSKRCTEVRRGGS
jgi:hypothetical protein